jgi:hypothetical protein
MSEAPTENLHGRHCSKCFYVCLDDWKFCPMCGNTDRYGDRFRCYAHPQPGAQPERSENLHRCPGCKNQFVQPFVCTTCGAQKLYDETVRQQALEIERLRNHIFNGQGLMQHYLDQFGSADGHPPSSAVETAALQTPVLRLRVIEGRGSIDEPDSVHVMRWYGHLPYGDHDLYCMRPVETTNAT